MTRTACRIDHGRGERQREGTAHSDSPFFPRNVQVHMELEQCPNAGILSGSVSFVEARRIPSAAADGILLSPAGIPYETRLL